MCSSPKMPPPPPPPQDAKEPDTYLTAKSKKQVGMAGGLGTNLTGSGGVPSSTLNTGGNTLLGG